MKILNFWTLNNNTVNINLSDINDFLSANGFGTYYRTDNTTNTEPLIVRIKNGIFSQYNVVAIRRFCIDYIEKSAEPDFNKVRIHREFIAKTRFLKASDFHILQRLDPQFVEDNENEAFFYFQNCPVRVSKNGGIQILDYSSIHGVIWDTQIIRRDFSLLQQQLSKESEFSQFVRDISTDNDANNAVVRYSQICCMLGYLLHDFKDPAFSKAVVLYDYSKNPKLQGGTGKTLLAKSLSELKKVKIIDGKLFSPQKSFAFSGIDKTTRLLVFDDIRPCFEFNDLLSIITSGLTVENKFQNNFHIPTEKSPKIVITSNYLIEGNSNSIRRRLMEFDFSDYYIKNLAPDKKFGHLLFTGWNIEEWNRFYNFMLSCVLKYFQSDALSHISTLNDQRRLMYSTCEEFITFVNQDLESTYDLRTGRYNKNKAYHIFIHKYWKKEVLLEHRVFTKWLQIYASSISAVYEETHSNNSYFFKLKVD
jgi:hypothetical protein